MARHILDALDASDISERQLQRTEMRKYLDALTRENPLTQCLERKGNTELLTSADVSLLWRTLEETIPVTPENKGIYQHLCDSSAFAARLAAVKPEAGIPAAEAAFVATVRNAGMLTGQKEYFRKSMVSTALAKRMGVREDLKAALLPLPAYITPTDEHGKQRLPSTPDADDPIIIENAHIILNNLTEQQKMMEMAGLLAKRDSVRGFLLSFDEIMDGHLKTRAGEEGYRTVVQGKKILWPSAYRALKDIEASRLSQSYAIVYISLLKDLGNSGFDHTKAVNEIECGWNNPDIRLEETQDALLLYLDAQEGLEA